MENFAELGIIVAETTFSEFLVEDCGQECAPCDDCPSDCCMD